MTNIQETTACYLAKEINAFADLMNPWDFRDFVNDYCEGSTDVADMFTWWDLLNLNLDIHTDWLREIAEDEDQGDEDRAKAADLLARVQTWAQGVEENNAATGIMIKED